MAIICYTPLLTCKDHIIRLVRFLLHGAKHLIRTTCHKIRILFCCALLCCSYIISSCEFTAETDRSSGWQPWYSLEMLKLVFNVPSEYQGCHPDDPLVSVVRDSTQRYFTGNEVNIWLSQCQRCKDNAWWCHQMETISALLALCAGNPPVTGKFPSQRPMTRSYILFSLICTWTNGWANNRDARVWDAIASIMTSLKWVDWPVPNHSRTQQSTDCLQNSWDTCRHQGQWQVITSHSICGT